MSEIEQELITGQADDAAMLAHDMSMSRNPDKALAGRALKAINAALDTWMDSERERGTSRADIGGLAANIVLNTANLLATKVAMGNPRLTIDILELLAPQLTPQLTHTVKLLKDELARRRAAMGGA